MSNKSGRFSDDLALPPSMAQSAAPDPFDLDSLRAPTDYAETGKTRVHVLQITASSRPPKDQFIRVRPFDLASGKGCFPCLMYEYGAGMAKTNYIVLPNSVVAEKLAKNLRRTLIVQAITRKGDSFLWEVRLPSSHTSGYSDSWGETRWQCARRAVDEWVKIEADQSNSAYQCEVPVDPLDDPVWPDMAFDEMFKLAYQNRVIRDLEHPVVKDFLGKL